MTQIDQMIEEDKVKLQKMHDEYNANMQQIQKIQQRNSQISLDSAGVAARINTLTQLREQGPNVFRNEAPQDSAEEERKSEAREVVGPRTKVN